MAMLNNQRDPEGILWIHRKKKKHPQQPRLIQVFHQNSLRA